HHKRSKPIHEDQLGAGSLPLQEKIVDVLVIVQDDALPAEFLQCDLQERPGLCRADASFTQCAPQVYAGVAVGITNPFEPEARPMLRFNPSVHLRDQRELAKRAEVGVIHLVAVYWIVAAYLDDTVIQEWMQVNITLTAGSKQFANNDLFSSHIVPQHDVIGLSSYCSIAAVFNL